MLGRDSTPAAVLRVVNRATEVEIAGGLSFGTTDRLKTILDATPTVRLVQLNNVGGWIQEGEKLGALIADRKLATYTARECDSACADHLPLRGLVPEHQGAHPGACRHRGG
jgi:hypothetical protein